MGDGNSIGKIAIGLQGVSIEGKAYDDLRPLILQSEEIGTRILTVVGKAIGLVLDFAEANFDSFRDAYFRRLRQIPPDFRVLPVFQLSASVAREVVLVRDEATGQQRLAYLLSTGSDSRTASNAHPSFASILIQLSQDDLNLLRRKHISECGWRRLNEGTTDAIHNLVRLGLFDLVKSQPPSLPSFADERAKKSDWKNGVFSSYDWQKENEGREEVIPKNLENFARLLEEYMLVLNSDLDTLGNRVWSITSFGTKFLEACVEDPTTVDAA